MARTLTGNGYFLAKKIGKAINEYKMIKYSAPLYGFLPSLFMGWGGALAAVKNNIFNSMKRIKKDYMV